MGKVGKVGKGSGGIVEPSRKGGRGGAGDGVGGVVIAEGRAVVGQDSPVD